MPVFDSNQWFNCIKLLAEMDKDWFPNFDDSGQIYLRMAHISNESTMGVKTPSQTKVFAILNPTSLRQKPLSLKCSHDVNKNWPLGHGQYTVSGNLGPLVPYVSEAKINGFDDVLWLLDDYVQEMTILNVFFVIKNRYGYLKLYTPLDNGCILSGITRQSIMEMREQIAKDTGMELVER